MFSKVSSSRDYCAKGICPKLSKAYEESVEKLDKVVNSLQDICMGSTSNNKGKKSCSKVTKHT